VRGTGLNRLSVLPIVTAAVLGIASCGGSGSNSGSSLSRVQHRAFISNAYSGALQIVNSQNDTTNFTPQTLDSSGNLIQGQPVSIRVGSSVTWQILSPAKDETAIYDQSGVTLNFVNNATEKVSFNIALAKPADMGVFSPDGATVYVPERNFPVSEKSPGGVQVIDVVNQTITTTYDVPSVSTVALSPSGQYLLGFAGNSDSVFLLDLKANTIAVVEIPGFARPVNAFFGSDSNTAYVINCGPECGSSAGPPSVTQLDIPSQTIKATVTVGGASVGYLNGTTLYVAGTAGTNGTYDAVNVNNMTRVTTASVPIGDGYHTTMALATNNKLYIGASTCSNNVTGCLSVVDVSSNTADAPLPPRGNVTGMLAVSGRNTVYVIEGGFLHIYDSTTDKLGRTQLSFTGALFGIVQVDP
jgi:WD40 repeat protein